MKKDTRPSPTQLIFKLINIFACDRRSYQVTMTQSHLLLFGDQTVEAYSSIKHLVRQSRDSPPLQDFLRRTTDALQSQISKLSPSDRERFSSFDSILSLAEAHGKTGSNDVVVSTLLLCVAQLGSLIRYGKGICAYASSMNARLHITATPK